MTAVRPTWYEFRDAVEQGDFSTAATLLQVDPSLIEARNGIGETVLHFLAVEDKRSGVEWLHAHGAALDTANEFGTPLLFEVALLGYQDLLTWLISRGADLNQKDANAQTVEEYLAEFDKPEMIEFLRSYRAP